MIYKKSMNILGVKYRVKLMDLITHQVEGYCDREKKVIAIEKKLLENPEKFYSTLAHEVGHALWVEGSIIQTGIPHEVEEIIVDLMSRVFYSEVIEPILSELLPPLAE